MRGPIRGDEPSLRESDEPLFDLMWFARRLRVRLAELGLSFRQAAPHVRVSPATLNRVARAAGLPDVETYLRIEWWLSQTEAQASTSNRKDGASPLNPKAPDHG